MARVYLHNIRYRKLSTLPLRRTTPASPAIRFPSISSVLESATVIVRSAQKGALAKDSRRRANIALADYARRRFPKRFSATPHDVLLRIAEEVRTRAAARGFEREDHVFTYFDLTVMYGAGFPESVWAEPILSNEALGPDHKMHALRTKVEETGVKL